MEYISRDEAQAQRAIYYFSGAQCKHGHTAKRYTQSGACCECHRLAMMATKEKYKQRDEEKRAALDAQRKARIEADRAEKIEERKTLAKERKKAWKIANAERIKAVNDAWIAANRERYESNIKRWRAENPDKVRQYTMDWAARNPDKEAERSVRRWEENKDLLRERNREWHAKNPDARRRYNNDYRAKKLAAGGVLSKDLVGKLFAIQRGKCACCRKLLGHRFHLDHIMPLALGGSNTDDNMQLLTQRCNNQKRAKHPVDFMQSRGFLL